MSSGVVGLAETRRRRYCGEGEIDEIAPSPIDSLDALTEAIGSGAAITVAGSDSTLGDGAITVAECDNGRGSEGTGALVASGVEGAISPTGVTDGDRVIGSIGAGDAVANANSVLPAESASRLLWRVCSCSMNVDRCTIQPGNPVDSLL